MKNLARSIWTLSILVCAALAVSADRRPSQVNLEVRFVEATSESLRDLGVNIGWGAGVSLNFAPDEKATIIPFIGASWDRMTGDNDFKSTISGLMAGLRIRLTPNVPLEKSQTSFVISEGYYENKHEDELFDEKSKGAGFDIGLEVGPAMGSRTPLFRFLFSQRPKTFGEKTQLLIITAAFPIKTG